MILSDANQKKEERTESLFIYVTPKVKKEFEMAKDNKALQDSIIKNHISSETDWLKSEMREIDEYIVKYRGKLLTIKDSFSEAQDSYINQIEEIYDRANNTFKKLDSVADSLAKKIDESYNSISKLSEKIGYINHDRLDKLIDSIDRFNSMNSEQKKLIELIINQQK